MHLEDALKKRTKLALVLSYRVPSSGTLNQSTDLPQCFRVTKSDKLHSVTDQPCDTSGV
jgi:hypothetical protein